ncbi:MAG TPA: helix-turn-helix transcriptional regulator, partial [Ktedonobacteraceae bacterium]
MKRTSYGERDYAFGQRMLGLRTSIGLTQAGLAGLLGISRQALGEWEAGSSYPKAEHLKDMIALGVRASAFAAGREEEEIRALWHAAHQKVLLDESW